MTRHGAAQGERVAAAKPTPSGICPAEGGIAGVPLLRNPACAASDRRSRRSWTITLTQSITTPTVAPIDADRDRREERHLLERVLRHRRADQPDDEHDGDDHGGDEAVILHIRRLACARCRRRRRTTPRATTTCSSSSATGSRSARATSRSASRAAAVKLGLVASNDLDEDEVADLVELAADGRIAEARSPLGAVPRPALGAHRAGRRRVARLLAAQARLPRRLPRPPRQGGPARGRLGRRERRVRVRGAAGRPGAPRARPDAVLARAPVPEATAERRRGSSRRVADAREAERPARAPALRSGSPGSRRAGR